MYKFLIVVLFAAATVCEPLDEVYARCGTDVKCAEEKVINLIDEYENRPMVRILGGFVIVEKAGEEPPAGRSEGVVDRILRYLSSHELKIKFPSNAREARSFLSETRSSKLKKIILPALLLLKLKAAVLIPAVLSAIALVAFKGLGAGLVALLLSAATAFKGLVESAGSKRVSFEVVPPHWSRAGFAPSGPPAAAYVQEWPIHPYQTLP